MLYDLFEKGIIKIFDENDYMDIERISGKIVNEIECEISMTKLDDFLQNEKVVIKKLWLIKIILN